MDTVDDWWRRAEAKRRLALMASGDKKLLREAFHNAGQAIEFALKAVIMKRKRFNRWPAKEERKDLYTHNLRTLLQAAEIDPHGLPAQLRKNLQIVCDWDRGHDYSAARVPRKVVRDMMEAAFGEQEGVMPWLKIL